MSDIKKIKRIDGFIVFVKDGKEVPEGTSGAKARVNDPHHEAKWAMDLKGDNFTASERKSICELRRLREAATAKPKPAVASKPAPFRRSFGKDGRIVNSQTVEPRGLGKAMKGIKTT